MTVETVTALGELTSPAANDEIGIWDVSAAQYMRITRANLVGGTITGGGTVATGGFTLTVPATGTAALIASGTWTPALTCGSGTITLGSVEGYYSQIGNLCFLSANMPVSGVSSPSGELTIEAAALPVVPLSNKIFTGVIYGYNLISTAATALQLYCYNKLYLRRFSAGVEVADLASKVQAGSQLTISIFYRVA